MSSSNPNEAEFIRLKANDGKFEDVSRNIACLIPLVQIILQGDPSVTEVPLPTIGSASLHFIVQYVMRHNSHFPRHIPTPIRNTDMQALCPDSRDAYWIDQIGENTQALYELILAASYLNVKSLLNLAITKQATLIKSCMVSGGNVADVMTKQYRRRIRNA